MSYYLNPNDLYKQTMAFMIFFFLWNLTSPSHFQQKSQAKRSAGTKLAHITTILKIEFDNCVLIQNEEALFPGISVESDLTYHKYMYM